jgi:hypothetical protein
MYRFSGEVDASDTYDTPYAGIGHGISVAAGDQIERGGVASWDVFVNSDQAGTAYVYGYAPGGTVVLGTVAAGTLSGSDQYIANVTVTTWPRLSFALINGGATADVNILVRARGN